MKKGFFSVKTFRFRSDSLSLTIRYIWMDCVGFQLSMNVCQRINILLTNFDSFNCRIKIVFDFTVNKTYL